MGSAAMGRRHRFFMKRSAGNCDRRPTLLLKQEVTACVDGCVKLCSRWELLAGCGFSGPATAADSGTRARRKQTSAEPLDARTVRDTASWGAALRRNFFWRSTTSPQVLREARIVAGSGVGQHTPTADVSSAGTSCKGGSVGEREREDAK